MIIYEVTNMKKTAACVLLISMLVFCGAAGVLADGIKYAAVESSAAAVSTGFYNCAAIKNDGTLWVWGFNGKGALGDETYQNSLKPKKVEGVENVKSADIGLFNTTAVTEDGELFVMGDKSFGQMGDGTSESGASKPRKVSNLGFINIAKVSHYALEKNGTIDVKPYVMAVDIAGNVYAWGSLEMGLSGDSAVSSSVPRKVSGLPGIADISVSGGRAIALSRSGDVYTWGYTGTDFYYADKAETEFSKPQKAEGLSNVRKISAGGHFLALDASGKVYGWGSNEYGEIKNKTYSENGSAVSDSIAVPTEITELSGYNIKDIYAGNGYSLFKTADGKLFGMGAYCSLFSDSEISDTKYPVEINVPKGFYDVSAGNSFISMQADDRIALLGDAGGFGTFGDGNTDKTSKNQKYADISGITDNEIFAVSEDGGSYLKIENPEFEVGTNGVSFKFAARTSGKKGISLAASLAIYDENDNLCAVGTASPSMGANEKNEYGVSAKFTRESGKKYTAKLFIWDQNGLEPCYASIFNALRS